MPDWVVPGAVLVAIGAALWKGGRWTGQVDSALTGLKASIDDLKGSVDGIRSALDSLLTSRSPAVQQGSPLGLSDYGKRLAGFLEAQDWIESTTPLVLAKVRGMKPHEVERFCEANIESYLDEAMNMSVDEATYEFGLSRKEILPVFWILLRDELLRLRTEAGGSGL